MSNYVIAYGVDTKTQVDPDELVLLTCPEEWGELDSEELEQQIDDEWGTEKISVQALVGVRDVFESLSLIIPTTPGIHPSNTSAATKFIIDALFDALDNNL